MMRAACTLAMLTAAGVGAVQAQTVWQFVDRDGVTHMGNVPPPAARGVIWIEGVGGAHTGWPKPGRTNAARLPGYAAAQPPWKRPRARRHLSLSRRSPWRRQSLASTLTRCRARGPWG